MNDSRRKIPCIIPTIPQDYNRLKLHVNYLFGYLPVKKIIYIGPASLGEIVKSDIEQGLYEGHVAEFIEEGEVVPFAPIKAIYDDLFIQCKQEKKSTANWYYQQYIKMAYARMCEDEYYLCWDGDTLPLKKIEMFGEGNKPFLDVKPEKQTSYFTTINRLFGYRKIISNSFISEHMLFKTEFMMKMISEIEALSEDGEAFYEVIMRTVGSDNLKLGFSEFETYGTWVAMNHPDAYRLRNWKSFRNANFFVDWNDVTEDDVEWLSKDYDAATFEKYHETEEVLNALFKDEKYRCSLSPEQFYHSVLESGAMGEYENGNIKVGNEYYPI